MNNQNKTFCFFDSKNNYIETRMSLKEEVSRNDLFKALGNTDIDDLRVLKLHKEFISILNEKKIIDFKNISNMINDSESNYEDLLVNKTIKFLDLFNYEMISNYSMKEFNGIYRNNSFLFNSSLTRDKAFEDKAQSAINNTFVLGLIGFNPIKRDNNSNLIRR